MLQTPGMVPLYLASIIGRLPIGALGLVLLLRTREMTGSYAAGGVVAAAFGLANGLSQPFLGRVIDRRGQASVLIPGAIVGGAALAGFAALEDGAPVIVAVLITAVAGAATPPLNSCVRALLSDVVAPAARHRAFALDSTLFELIYITGPLVLVGVVGAWSLRAAVLTCAALTLAGTLLFAATRLSRLARGAAATSRDLMGPLRDHGVRTQLLSVALFGLSIASLEVGLTGFADDEGHRNAVGYLLGCSGLGSMVGGLITARTPAPADPRRRLVLLLVGLAVLEAPLALMQSLPAMAVAVTIAGLALAPTLAITFQLTSEAAPDGTVTEALTWLSSAISLGLAIGSAISGALVEHVSTTFVLITIAGYTAIEAAVVAART